MNPAVLAFISGAVEALPSIISLGTKLMPYVNSLREAVESLFSDGHITEEQFNDLRAKIAASEAAWNEEVNRAQQELDLEASKGQAP